VDIGGVRRTGMKKVISCCVVTAFLGSLGYVMSRPVALQGPGQAKSDPGMRLLEGVGAAVAIVLPVGCGGGGGPTPPTPPRTFTTGLSREAVFTGTAGSGRHEVTAGASGTLEATFTADRGSVFLRMVSPSGKVMEARPGILRIATEPGRWVFSVRGEGGEPVGYRLRVLFP
jgi:hypothetical protein